MEHYAGIDVSLERSSVCVVDSTGRIVREAKVASEPEALVRLFGQLGLPLTRVGLEAGPLSQWLHAGLTKAGFEAVLLETRHVKAALSAMVVKTDRRDARGIAQLLRMGWYRPVHRKSPPAQEVRALLVGRKLLQGKLLDVELSIRGILRGFGLKLGQRRGLPAADDGAGAGALVAVTFASAVDDPGRFTRSRAVGAHFGLTPKRYQSGETDVTGGISKVGDAMVRTALYEAANVMLTRAGKFSTLKRWALEVAQRRGMRRAKVALARKLATVLHRLWVDGSEFRFGKEAAAA